MRLFQAVIQHNNAPWLHLAELFSNSSKRCSCFQKNKKRLRDYENCVRKIKQITSQNHLLHYHLLHHPQHYLKQRNSSKRLIWLVKEYVTNMRQQNLIFLDMQMVKNVVLHVQSIQLFQEFIVLVVTQSYAQNLDEKNTRRH